MNRLNKYQRLINQIAREDYLKSNKQGVYVNVSLRDLKKIYKEVLRERSVEYMREFRDYMREV